MDQATFNALMHQVGAMPIAGFFLVLARIAPLFLTAPLFSSPMVPTQVRTIVGVALALGMTGLATHGQRIPSDAMSFAALMIVQVVVGLAFALAVGAVFYAIESAGALLDILAGFSYGQLIDPIDRTQGGVLTGLYGVVGLMIFLAVGGEAWTLRGLARTFRLVPLTGSPQIRSLVGGVMEALGSIFVSAIEIAAPALLALLITDVAFGMVSRVVPQINIFAIGFSAKIGVTLLVVVAALPLLGPFIAGQTATAVNGALQTITTI